MPEITLFDDQEEFVEKIRRQLRAGNQSVLGVASTGFGKTIVSAFIAKEAARHGKRVWFLCHLKNLLTQTSQAFWKLHIEHGLIAAGKRNSKLPVQVATVGTLARRLDQLQPPDLLIVDEAHLAMAKTWVQVVDWAKSHGAIVIGNSATPERLDGKGLGYLFDTMVEARPMQWLIENGRLSEYVVYSTKNTPDLSGVKTRGGDWATNEIEAAVDKPKLIGDAAVHWKKYASGLRTIAYCATIKHSKHTAEHFNRHGISAVHVDGETPQEELRAAIRGFADGKYMVLCNVQLMTTGFDLSAQVNRDVPIEAAILLRPTQSVSLYMQMVGRALRMKENPAVILDHAGMVMKHGLPDDVREWSLEGRKKGKRKASEEDPDVNVQQCQNCFHIFRPGPSKCPACGSEIERKVLRELEQIDGELERIDVAQLRRERKMQQGQSKSLRDLVLLGVRRGMKNPSGWAAYVYCSRAGRKPTAKDYEQAKRVLREV